MTSLCMTSSFQKPFSSLIRPNTLKRTLELYPALSSAVSRRNTFILRRKYPVKLNKIGCDYRKLKAKDFLYELVEFKDCQKKPDIEVLLKDYVEGVGRKGQCVTLPRNVGYKLLISNIADYATPEAIEKAKLQEKQAENEFSSLSALQTVKYLENMMLTVNMSKDIEWTLEPWHIKVNFRKAGVHMPVDSITLPKKPIKGPNLDLEHKLFCVTVTINHKEKATVRCLLHHCTPNPSEKLPFIPNFYALQHECIFPEDEEKIKKLPVIKYKSVVSNSD